MTQGAARAAEVRLARDARARLAETLSSLERASEAAAAQRALGEALDAIHAFETSENAVQNSLQIKDAVKQLGISLRQLQSEPVTPAVENAIEAVARLLALMYPLSRSHQRRRQRRSAEPEAKTDSLPESAALSPPAPEPIGHAPNQLPFTGQNKRAHGQRVFVEVDIGLFSQSNFYTGLSRDISHGGVFVATYQPQPPGTRLTLYFVLPSGRAVQAEGVVRWTTDARDGVSAPGMGVAFEGVSDQDTAAILEFCEARKPLYFDAVEE